MKNHHHHKNLCLPAGTLVKAGSIKQESCIRIKFLFSKTFSNNPKFFDDTIFLPSTLNIVEYAP